MYRYASLRGGSRDDTQLRAGCHAQAPDILPRDRTDAEDLARRVYRSGQHSVSRRLHHLDPRHVAPPRLVEGRPRAYATVLQHGIAPRGTGADCPSEIIEQILFRHLSSPAMFTIIPLQDWFALDDSIKRPDAEAERINVPADSHHYWRYRMHITLEQLMQADSFNQHVRRLVESSGRK